MVGRAATWTAMAVLLTCGMLSIANSAAPYCTAILSFHHFRFLLVVLTIAAIVISRSLHHGDRLEEEEHHHHHLNKHRILDFLPPPPVPLVRELSRRLSREFWSHLPAFHAEPQEFWRDIPVDSGNGADAAWPSAPPLPQVEEKRTSLDANGIDIPFPAPPPQVEAEEGTERDGNDTMDATWKAISDAKKVMEKSWTWERRHRAELESKAAMRRMETLRGAEEMEAGGRRWRRHEIVMDKDELSRQVEAFIKNHYLQRQESEKRRRLGKNGNSNGHDFLHRNYYQQPPISV